MSMIWIPDLEVESQQRGDSNIQANTSLIDLTSDDSDIVDLTGANDTSIVILSPRDNNQQQPKTPTHIATGRQEVVCESPTHTLSCAICLDSLKEIHKGNKKLMSTRCGHIFCKPCIQLCPQSLGNTHGHRRINTTPYINCPVCRRKLLLNENDLHVLHL